MHADERVRPLGSEQLREARKKNIVSNLYCLWLEVALRTNVVKKFEVSTAQTK